VRSSQPWSRDVPVTTPEPDKSLSALPGLVSLKDLSGGGIGAVAGEPPSSWVGSSWPMRVSAQLPGASSLARAGSRH